MRAVVQGLDTRQSWDRYLRLEGEHDDIRHVRRTIQRIRDEFAAAARRHARHGIARLIQIDAGRLDDRGQALPSLEEFAVERGLEEFSQAEQLDYYREHFGTAPHAVSRRRRVIARQLDALRWLEELVAVPPKPTDPPSYWIHPDIASRLEAAGLVTLDALARQINGVGFRWWAGIPGIGVAKAERIVEWLRGQESTLRLSIGPHVDTPRQLTTPEQLQKLVGRGAEIVPIEKFVPPPGLDGSTGRFRGPKEACMLGADNDIDAILSWVASKPANSSTRRAYLKEGERFLLWSVLVQGKPLSSLDAADCSAYLGFLTDPQPRSAWCGPRGREKWSPLWRPFEGPLSDAAKRHAIVILKNLFSHLAAHGYLVANPWSEIALPQARKQKRTDPATSLWRLMFDYARSLPSTSANARLLFVLQLIPKTGLRLSEAVAVKLGDLQVENGSLALRIAARAGKQRRITLTPELQAALGRYLQSRGLHEDPLHPANKDAFLLGQTLDLNERAPWSPLHLRQADAKAGIAAGTLHAQLKSFFAACADHAPGASSADKAFLAAATADWLRSPSAGADTAT